MSFSRFSHHPEPRAMVTVTTFATSHLASAPSPCRSCPQALLQNPSTGSVCYWLGLPTTPTDPRRTRTPELRARVPSSSDRLPLSVLLVTPPRSVREGCMKPWDTMSSVFFSSGVFVPRRSTAKIVCFLGSRNRKRTSPTLSPSQPRPWTCCKPV